MIRVVIADDHPVVRKGLQRILEEVSDVQVVAEAANGDELISRLAVSPADVVLLDISMPGPGFMETLKSLTTNHPEVKILVLSIHSEDQYAVQALRNGAAGYVMKDRPPEELVAAIRRVYTGGRHMSLAVSTKLAAAAKHRKDSPPHDDLSAREFDTMRMLASGKSVKEIAETLQRSPKTISTFRARILKKMGWKSNADMVRYLLERKMLP